jgi:hypothetical protein
MTGRNDVTALEGFKKRNLVPYLMVAAFIGVGTVASRIEPVGTVDVHFLQEDEAGKDTLKAAETRIADQFEDVMRLVPLIDGLADQPTPGADKMRAVTMAYNQMAAMKPDGGAAAHDTALIEAAGRSVGVDFKAGTDRLNDDKKDLSRAVGSLIRIQDALLKGDEEMLPDSLAEMEASVARFDSRRPPATVAQFGAGQQSTVAVSLDRMKAFVAIKREQVQVNVERPKVYLSR